MKRLHNRLWLIIFLFLSTASYRYLPAEMVGELSKRYKVNRLFPADIVSSATFDDSLVASLLIDDSDDAVKIIVSASGGTLAALNHETGAVEWQLAIPARKNQQIQLIATPVKIGSKLVVVYQCIEKGQRTHHRLTVLDLLSKSWDKNFKVLELSAQKQAADRRKVVKFNPPTAYSHAALKHVKKSGSTWGTIYAAFGNAGDTQPFHGWLYEIDMDAWLSQDKKKVISGVLLTTPEAECPVNVEYGTQEMICGGGIWAPAGPQIYSESGRDSLYVPTGNGQIDLKRHDYANTLMRLHSGLKFDPECDAAFCRNFDPSNPDEACISSCKNLFIPRLPVGSPPFRPANRECDDKTFAECLAWMDYDLGGSAPVKVSLADGNSVLIQPGKDGAVYLIDAEHLGTQFDRLQIVDLCGTEVDPCKASWMGMIVTQPVVVSEGTSPVVIIPTFVPDRTHPGGVVALTIVNKNGRPKFEQHWRFPSRQSEKALTAFRSHPSFPVISRLKHSREDIVWVVDTGNPGTLYGLSVKSGKVLVEQPLRGTGRQLSLPVIYDDMIYLASSSAATGKTFVEAYRISQ